MRKHKTYRFYEEWNVIIFKSLFIYLTSEYFFRTMSHDANRGKYVICIGLHQLGISFHPRPNLHHHCQPLSQTHTSPSPWTLLSINRELAAATNNKEERAPKSVYRSRGGYSQMNEDPSPLNTDFIPSPMTNFVIP